MAVPESSPRAEDSPLHERRSKGRGTRRNKRWYQRTSVTLCVAAAMAVVGLGFVHVIVGVTSSYGLPFDIVVRESFGYREAIVDAGRIESLPYAAACFKYPLSVAALHKGGYTDGGPAFEARMASWQRECVGRWQAQFESSLGRPAVCRQDHLLGQEQVPGSDPESSRACNQRGIALARSGEYQAALAEFTRAIRRDPTCADAFYNRAQVSIEIGNLGQAASDLGTVVEIRPGFTEARIRRGRLYVAMNDRDRAIAEFTKAVEIDPKCGEAIFHRGLVHFVRGDYERALADVQKIESLGQVVPTEFTRVLRGE
ncbi:MAG TPA: tetratricopeptide repeat protein [Sedimentisphaerales bacterium]|nr:tetratricopeptide repeat protein [Sedimentisphaerales bacterium]